MTKQISALTALGLAGCIGIFANDFEIDFEAELLSVETLSDSSGAHVVCRMRLTATASGEDGERGIFGEADFAFRRLGDDAYLGGEHTSAAFMGSLFGSEEIDAGETLSTNAFERAWPEPFEWQMEVNYRRPGGTRGTEELSLRCE